MAQHDDVQLSSAAVRLESPQFRKIGFLRAAAHDLALFRHAARLTGEDHILVRCDADTRGVDREYVANYLARFAAAPDVDAFAGKTLWSPERCRNAVGRAAIKCAGWRSRLYTSSRRAEAALLEGQPSIAQWSNESTKFAEHDPSVRNHGENGRSAHKALSLFFGIK